MPIARSDPGSGPQAQASRRERTSACNCNGDSSATGSPDTSTECTTAGLCARTGTFDSRFGASCLRADAAGQEDGALAPTEQVMSVYAIPRALLVGPNAGYDVDKRCWLMTQPRCATMLSREQA
jgi:hypothetical protein